MSRLSQLMDNFLGVWLVVLLMALVFAVGRLFFKTMREGPIEQPDLPLFGGIALVLGATGFGVFIKLSGLPTQVWYYIPVLCFTVVCCDAILPRVHSLTRIGVVIIAGFALVYSSTAYSALRYRQSNGDLLAAQISKTAVAGDLIIVHPWYFGMTFARYYEGVAKWQTLPPITNYHLASYDLIKEKIQTPHAITPVLEQLTNTLRSGHRVWVVGEISPPLAGRSFPADPPVAPNGPSGWLDEPYSTTWGKQLSCILGQHATKIEFLTNASPATIRINPMEKMNLIVARGWQTNSP